MAFEVIESQGNVTVRLTGRDRILCWRRKVEIPQQAIRSATVKTRGDLEPTIEHRLAGIGTHDGKKRPNRRRVGPMLGRHLVGPQFWAVEKGQPDQALVVLDLTDHEFVRVVLSPGPIGITTGKGPR